MKAIVFAAVFCLFASTVMGMQYPQTYAKLQRIAGTKFGKSILETIQVELQTKEDPRPTILTLIQELIDETNQAQAAHDARIERERQACTTEQEHLAGEIERLDAAIKADTITLGQKETALEEGEANRDAKEQEISGYEAEITRLDNQRASEQAEYEKRDAKYAKLLEVLRKVRQYIQTRLDTRYETGAFLQKKATTEIYNSLAEIKETVSSASFAIQSPGYARMISFIASKAQQALSETPGEADAYSEKRFGDILSVIDDLIAKFEGERKDNSDLNDSNIALYNKNRGIVENDLSDARGDLSVINQNIEALRVAISSLNGRLASNKADLESSKTQLENSKERCENQENEYATLSQQRTDELALLREVKQIVQEELSGLRETTEEAIKNSDITVWTA